MHPALVLVNGEVETFPARSARLGAVEVAVELHDDGPGLRLDWSVRNAGNVPVPLGRVGVVLSHEYARVLEHGWQSWSVVRPCTPDDVRPERRRLPEWQRAMRFGDAGRAGHVVSGEQFLLTDTGLAGFLDGARHLGVVEARGAGAVTALALLDGAPLAPGAQRPLHPLWFASGDAGTRYAEYAARWGAEAQARAAGAAPFGWCSWYQHYTSVTPGAVLAAVARAAERGLELVQIDDGYQAAIGSWLTTSAAWDGRVAETAAAVRDAGLQAGLWTAPFLVDEAAPLVREHPDWLLADASGAPVRAMHSPQWWGGWALALDTTHPAVREHLASTFSELVARGFGYHKLDFCYAAALPGRRHDAKATRAEALRAGLETVRAAVGDGGVLVACGCPFGPAAGVVDGMRVSPDVAPNWLPRRALPGLEEAASCARNALVTSLLRSPLHRRLWVNDNDCLLLRPLDTGLDAWQRRTLAAGVAGVGAATIVSDDLSLYGEEEWDLLERVRALAAETHAPPVLVDPFADVLTVRRGTLELAVSRAGPHLGVAGRRVLIDAGAGVVSRAR